MEVRKLLIISSFLLLRINGFGQNLINNGNFESYKECPEGNPAQAKPSLLDSVSNPNNGTFDFIHECDSDNYPRFYWGEQSPKEGKGYVGICVYSSTSETREYIQLSFKDPLIKGEIYKFKMNISLADKSIISINNIGVYISEKLTLANQKEIKVKPNIISPKFYNNYKKWELYKGDYIAKGGETHLIIGNFKNNLSTKTKLLRGGMVNLASVYYYIDDVSFTVNQSPSDGIVLNNINFKTNSSKLISSSLKTIDRVVLALINNQGYKLTINGHTDNVGDAKSNISLSYDRAKIVAEYIANKGINKNRLIVHGKGDKEPIVDNSNKYGRLKNRRVEFKFGH